LRGDACLARLVGIEERRRESVAELRREVLHEAARRAEVRVEREAEAEAELRVVLEQRVRPRRSAAVAVGRVRRGREVAAVDRRAAGGVRDEEAIAEELRQQLQVRRLAAAGAGARVLEQRLQELRALVIDASDGGAVRLGQTEEELVVGALRLAQRRLRVH